jgi:hypothetical protein
MRFQSLVYIYIYFLSFLASGYSQSTTALYLFDEQIGIYPSSVLNDNGPNDYPLVIGPGGQIVPGKFGRALEPIEQTAIVIPEGEEIFGLQKMPIPEGRTVEPMTWFNANFCALMTSGEKHLRKEVGFVHPTKTNLNLGNFDWIVEFWYMPTRQTREEGVVFEIGQGPRGENQKVTRLLFNADQKSFTLFNEPGQITLLIPSNSESLNPKSGKWHHLAFSFSAKEKQLRHYVNGILQKLPAKCTLTPLNFGEEDYMSIGRDGLWNRPLSGKMDELKFSKGTVYKNDFIPPKSFSNFYNGIYKPEPLLKGEPLLFAENELQKLPIELGNRKHLFIDEALVEKMENVSFNVNPPKFAGRVIDEIEGSYRKHLTVVEDEDGLLRLYNSVQNDYLQVMTSRDGVHWESPDFRRGEFKGHKNIVIPEPVGGLGNPFIDPNGTAETKWKYITGYHNRGIFLYKSPDGWSWTRQKTYVLPFRSGTQSCTFYDEQRQLYVGYHRTGFAQTPAGVTQRESVLTEVNDLFRPWEFEPITQKETWEAAKKKPLRQPQPWYLDNGPLTPGGFSLEFPIKFAPIDSLDPVGTDIYITKAQKYPWAPDTYLAFPIVYFHYEADGPITRRILMDPERDRGSGPLETQIEVSRDGVNWKRYSRPAYIGIGRHEGRNTKTTYIAHGMVRRGDEIWQYYFGEPYYHSAWSKDESGRGVYRVVQRLDGFISADTPYDKEGIIITKPLVFKGNRLVLNIDTDATGYAQVGFLDQHGKPIKGFSSDDCVYINGDFIEIEVEWIKNRSAFSDTKRKTEEELFAEMKKLEISKDVSDLQGKTVQLVFRMRGAKLYSMQFNNK